MLNDSFIAVKRALRAISLGVACKPVFEMFLKSGEMVRILVAIVLIFPLGFFLGMPFPLGILAVEKQPTGAIAWAWAMNGLFTVIGGMLSVLLSIFYGFKVTLLVAMLIYCLAFFLFSRMRTVAIRSL